MGKSLHLYKHNPPLKGGIIIFILVVIHLVLGAVINPVPVVAGPNYGNENPPFWYPLTPFERQTLAMAEQAGRGGGEVLLRTGLMAAGVRDEAAFQAYRRKIQAFLDKVKPELARVGNSKELGRLLHEKMHRYLLLPAIRNKRPYGYSLDQSSLAVLLDTGRFNCTSSALLYLILAEYFDLDVRGVVVPKHVFVELRSGGGGTIDIETTNSDGFGKVHDRKFYRQQAENWASWRGLQPVTFQDYQRREFLTPLELAAMNMDDQHTRQGSMGEDDRLRLKEAQSLIMAGDRKKQMQRLGLYNNEYNRLRGQGDYRTLVKMFTAIEPVMDEIAARWPNDPVLTGILSWLYYQQADSFYRAGELGRVLALMNQSLDLDQRSNNGDDRRVRGKNMTLLALMVKDFLANSLYAEALKLCDGFNDDFQGDVHFIEIYRMIYSNWANYHWQRREWDEALDLFNEELALIPPTGEEEAERLRSTIAGCYLNRGASAMVDNDWQKAIGFYQEGLIWTSVNAPDRIAEFRRYLAISYQGRAISSFKQGDWAAAADDFAKQLEWADEPAMRGSVDKNLRAVFNNWKNGYLHGSDLAGAKGVLRQCIDRFPWIDLCREQLQSLEKIHRM